MIKDWLSATWEPSWRSFQYFNLYRLIVAAFLLLSLYLPLFGMPALLGGGHVSVAGMLLAYALLVGVGAALSLKIHAHFNRQLTLQVMLDVLAVGYLIFALGGVNSGMGLLLMISLGAASLVGRGRLVLFYAALASLMVLGVQLLSIWAYFLDLSTIVAAGLLSAAYFMTAILARLLGQRLMTQEELARRRGVALDDQMRINRRILERMQDGVLVVSRGGVALRHNPEAEVLLGIPQGDSLLLAAHAPALAVAMARWSQKGGVAEMEIAGAGGRRLGVRFEVTDSSAGEALVFLEDRSQVQEQARQLKLAALGRLTASIAHEIRNPLAAISHASELLTEALSEARLGGAEGRLLRILGDNVYRLDRIVQDVLKLGSRDQARPEPLLLNQFLPKFVEEFCAVETVPPGTLECRMLAGELCFDRAQLLQVLWNLVGNAVRHSRQLSASVRLWESAASDGRVELHIADDGPGIPESSREQIFEPFYTTRHEGTGLGLFIARELCEANGASLELLPEGLGAHFVIVGGKLCPTSNVAPEAR